MRCVVTTDKEGGKDVTVNKTDNVARGEPYREGTCRVKVKDDPIELSEINTELTVTGEQKEILVEFMGIHPELISGKFSSSFSKKDGEALWKLLGETLNSTIGPQKEWKAWIKTWQDLCARTKQKCAANWRESNKTGGGVGNFQSLSQTEKCIAAMLTPVAVQGLNIPTPKNELSDPDFRCRPRQICERGKDIKGGTDAILEVLDSATGAGEPVEEDRSGWKIVQEELQPYAAADLGFLHEGQPPYASADHISPPCWAGVIPQDPTREQDLTPDCPWPRNPKSRGNSYLARSFSVFLVLVRHFGSFLLHSFVIRPEVTSPETTRSAGKGRGEEGPRGLSKDSDGVIDQRRKRDSEDLPPAHSSLDSSFGFQAPGPV
ncbi:hypothetical protein MTP99_002906 [Tenebrio molitor]|nr:hypothetical protein MTP99_002906 [Tenebrio molitor]